MTSDPLTEPSSLQSARRTWAWRSSLILVSFWAVLQIGGLFTPGLLDDVDSVYIQIAREMLGRHDYVTPTIDGIRFFDKPPLMYWMAAASMRIFGTHDWAARLPLALGVLALLFAVYWLGIRLFAAISPATAPDRGGLYAALTLATAIGPYLYTRFFIPDILVALWMTLAVHSFLVAVQNAEISASFPRSDERTAAFMQPVIGRYGLTMPMRWAALFPMLAFGAVLALSVLTKGLIGLVFPILFAVLYLACTGQLRLLRKLHLLPATLTFLLIALPWHVLAALRNPAIAMPAGIGLPPRAGWAWFYLYNEHIARFLGKRIPHDYGQVPVPLFWLLLVLWLAPWAAFLPAAVRDAIAALRQHRREAALRFDSDVFAGQTDRYAYPDRSREAAISLLLWAGVVLGFFTLSSRQEYYHLPALPALALLVGGLLASADRFVRSHSSENAPHRVPLLFGSALRAQRAARRSSAWGLVPFASVLAVVCGYLAIASPRPPAGATLHSLLSSNPDLYNLSLGHVYDLTGQAMGFFRGPLITVALGMAVLGPVSHILRRSSRTLAANLLLAGGMSAVLLAAHEGLVRFNPILGSKDLADIIKNEEPNAGNEDSPVLIDGELTSGSSLLFYLDNPVLLVNGRVNGPWFGSFWPDARGIFLDDADLLRAWHTRDVYLLTYHPEQRIPQLCQQGPVLRLADSGGKTVLRNFVIMRDLGSPARSSDFNVCPHGNSATPATPPAHPL